MKRFVLALIITATIAVLPTTAMPFDFPPPAGHVTDVAKIIPQEKIDSLEKRLRDYNKQTTIEIAVVTTPSLDGMPIEQWTIELVEKPAWKVGKKGKDNGLVIVIAPKERKYRIEVGYGLQGDLTDARAGRLGQQNLVESFRAKDYAGGIDKLVSAIMNTLGTYNEEERAKMREQQKQLALKEAQMQKRRDEQMKTTVATVFIGLLAIAVLAGIAYGLTLLFRKISRARKEARRKDSLRNAINKRAGACQENTSILTKKMKDIATPKENYPEWALEKTRQTVLVAGKAIEMATQKWQSATKDAKDDPDNAGNAITSAEDQIKKAESWINEAALIPSLIERYKNEAPMRITEAESVLQYAIASIEKAAAAGFRTNGVSGEIKKEAETVSSLKNAWSASSENDRYAKGLDFLDNAMRATETIRATAKMLETTIATKEKVDTELAAFPAILEGIEESMPGQRKDLAKIKKDFPAENWKDLENEFLPIPDALAAAKKLYHSAMENNSMIKQNFQQAAADMGKATDIVNSSNASLAKIGKRRQEIEAARMYFNHNLENVSLKVRTAAAKVTESDVSATAANTATRAAKMLKDVKSQAEKTAAMNWILAAEILAAIALLAANAISTADSDIADAQRARVRRRREEESYYSSSSSSSSYGGSSSSSSDSFGGFGGGDFGGGGASGGW